MTGESSSRGAKGCAFITGATGFVGSHLTRRLVTDGWSVHILVRPSSDRKLLQDLEGRFQTHIHFGNTEQLCALMSDVRPNVVFHLASLFVVHHHPEDILPLFESNLVFPSQLLEAMAKNGVTRLINTGTSWQHYNNKNDNNPVCLYAATKQAVEAIMEYYIQACGIKAITLKLFDTYGSDDPRPKLLSLFKKAAETGEPLGMSAGEQLIDLVHIDDVIEAYVIAAQRLLDKAVSQHERYAVSSGNPLSLKELVKLYAEVTKQVVAVNWGARPYRYREVMVPWNKGRSVPGWVPRTSLVDGIRNAYRQDL